MCVVFGKNNNKTKIKQIKRNQKTTLRRGRLFGLVFVSFWFGIIVVYFLSSNFFGCLPDLISCLLVVFVCVCVCVCVSFWLFSSVAYVPVAERFVLLTLNSERRQRTPYIKPETSEEVLQTPFRV